MACGVDSVALTPIDGDGSKRWQDELAAKLKRPPSYVGKTENGERRIEVYDAVDWCAACGVELAVILKKAGKD